MSQWNKLQAKVYTTDTLQSQIAEWRKDNQKIVFTNGCFDLLHLGHVDYLAKARDLGDKLIIGLNTDTSVSRIKGPSRPIKDQKSRATILAAMQFVDAVIFFDEETPIDLITWVKPDVLVKGGDYTLEGIVGHEIVLEKGGEVKTIPFVEGYSSSKLIEKITQK
ncbi:MAG: D-glycero-beta-D-manno-heptose 1-phosphate adenylyltransferase [Flavobacteriales bacterium]|jgi:rfaE bifunctional protein nucleotidyltransferase chain/domain|tara:strand:- start:432 stop:923 length:492 start_codon:yes stop_codon:yes gene_type:complete